jgi:hypothetical protein
MRINFLLALVFLTGIATAQQPAPDYKGKSHNN